MAGERILVTDDEELILQLCRRILVKRGYEVAVAPNGAQALEICEKIPIDILLTDLKMPGMDGLTLIQEARKHRPELMAMVITGHGTVDTAIESLKMGVMGFIVKPFTPDALLTSIQNALEKVEMLKENIRLKSLMPLFDINKNLMSEVELNRLLKQIVSHAVKETRAEEGSLGVMDRDGGLRTCVVTDFVPNMTGILEGRVGERISRMTLKQREPIMLHRHVPSPQPPGAEEEGLNHAAIFENNDLLSILSVPLMKKDQLIGVLNLSKLTDNSPFTEADRDLIFILCGQAAVMIENARLFRDSQQKAKVLEETTFDVVRTLVQALEMKDDPVRDHSDRLINYAMAIAERFQLSGDDKRRLKFAALLRDIGKIAHPHSDPEGASDAKGSMVEAEVQNHSVVGAEIVKRIKFVSELAPVIYHHHERWDGKGSPDGLSADAIPVCSRILAVIDAFDRMTSDGPSQQPLSLPKAIASLQSGAGKEFDPAVVDAFLHVLNGKNA